jgi:hypothetical protein
VDPALVTPAGVDPAEPVLADRAAAAEAKSATR